MKTTITLKSSENEDVKVELTASAFTPVLYRELFKKDMFVVMQAGASEMTFIIEFAYILAKETVLETPEEKKFPSFRKWAMQFHQTTFLEHAGEIMEFWTSSSETIVDSKNE